MTLRKLGLLAFLLTFAASANWAQAAGITINGLDFNLDQFAGAGVTTNVSAAHVHASTFENLNGFDGYELGELAIGHFGADEGDRISLGDFSAQDTLTLTYGTPVTVGPGQASLFVVLEQASSSSGSDAEGRNFEISINGGLFVNGNDSDGFDFISGPGDAQNETIFDLTGPNFGLSIGDVINTVTIRNLIGNDGTYDPDFLFAGRAGTDLTYAPVPEPASLAVWGLVSLCGGGSLYRRRKQRREA